MEILRGRGVLKTKIFKGKYEAKLEFPGGVGGPKPKTVRWGGMDIFWNHIIDQEVYQHKFISEKTFKTGLIYKKSKKDICIKINTTQHFYCLTHCKILISLRICTQTLDSACLEAQVMDSKGSSDHKALVPLG